MTLMPVAEALARLLNGVTPTEAATVPLADAAGRVLAADLAATRTQPPFPASAMDGYAVAAADVAEPGARLRLIGTSRAGARFQGWLGRGETVRILTGAPVPAGADAILIQENAIADGDCVTATAVVAEGQHVRPEGLDFRAGEVLLPAGTRLGARTMSLAAATGHATVPVRRRPHVAVLATGDELVAPGAAPGPDQIISSNTVGIAALAEAEGATALDGGIAADQVEAIDAAVAAAGAPDILVVSGGASVGDHDLVQEALTGRGMRLDFWRIAMRPGKPMMVGRLGPTRVLGLPGNPVSSLVTSTLFLAPLIRAFLGLPTETPRVPAWLGAPLPENDRREDYVRARLDIDGGERVVTPFERQDSSMLATLARSGALIVRAPHAPPAATGDTVEVIVLNN